MLAIIAFLCVIYTAGAASTYPSVFPDPAYGLLVEQSRARGAPWNHYTEPAPEDISLDRHYFNAAWSPGQHMVPTVLTRAGLSLGAALRIVNIAASLAGLLGWFRLHRALGFDRSVALAAGVLIAMARSFTFPFLTYIGGDLLAFAAFPHLALAVLRLQPSPWLIAAAPALVLAGFFFKHSLAIYVAGWTAAVVAVGFISAARPTARRMAFVAFVAITVAGALRFIEWGYASRGWSAIVYQPAWSRDPATYLVPWAMPMLASTGVDHVLSRIFDNPQFTRFDYRHSLWVLAPAVIATVLMLRAAYRTNRLRTTASISALFVALVVTVFSYLLATGSTNELYLSRHYVIAGFVLLPIMVQQLAQTRRAAIRAAGVAVLMIPALYGVLAFASNWNRHFDARASHVAEVGISHLATTPRVLDAFHALDRTVGRSALVVVPDPSLALEFPATRVLATRATSLGPSDFDRSRWHGRASNLIVITEDGGQTREEIRAWLASFESYDRSAWSSVSVDGFSFHVPRGQSIDPAWLESTFAESRAGGN